MKVSLSKNFPLAGFLFLYLSLVTWYSPSPSPLADTILLSPDWKLPVQLCDWRRAGSSAVSLSQGCFSLTSLNTDDMEFRATHRKARGGQNLPNLQNLHKIHDLKVVGLTFPRTHNLLKSLNQPAMGFYWYQHGGGCLGWPSPYGEKDCACVSEPSLSRPPPPLPHPSHAGSSSATASSSL